MTIMFAVLVLIFVVLIFIGLAIRSIGIYMDELEKKMDDYNNLVRLMADHSVELGEKDGKVLNLLERTLDLVKKNSDNAKDVMQVCTDILSVMKGEQDDQN